MRAHRSTAVAVACALATAFTLLAPVTAAGAQRTAPNRTLRWLSLGDSFGAGEGATAASGACQRSPNASGPKAATILREARGWRINADAFAACTGWLAADLFASRSTMQRDQHQVNGAVPETGSRVPDIRDDQSLVQWAFAQSGNQKFDVVVASLGGNDVGFADIVKDCIDLTRKEWLVGGAAVGAAAGTTVLGQLTSLSWDAAVRAIADNKDPEGCQNVKPPMTQRIDTLIDDQAFPGAPGVRGLIALYRKAADELLSNGGVFVVMGYPRLLTPSSDWGEWRNGQCNMMSAKDADLVGRAAEHFDRRLRDGLRGDPRFVFVSRLEIFDDHQNFHSLCSRGTEWVNTPLVFLRDGTMRYERGFHPNDLGYLATAEAVAGEIDHRLGTMAVTTTSSTGSTVKPTVRSSDAHFEIGDKFSDQCTIPWPFAPTRGRSSITFRTTCVNVPSQFLFVDITYGDENFVITSSRRTVKVTGTIADVSRSEFGFTVLVVEAKQLQLVGS